MTEIQEQTFEVKQKEEDTVELCLDELLMVGGGVTPNVGF